MCGLVGVAGVGKDLTLENKYKVIFRDMLMLDTIRGAHSTGVALVDTFDTTHVLKTIGTPWDMMDMRSSDDLFRRRPKVIMGHNRWATKGKINKNNAHPFENTTIVGAHNGTLRNQSLLPDHNLFDVDSENIFHAFDVQGVTKTVKNLCGAYALVWWNKVENTLHFLRNDERPLFYAYDKANQFLLYASEIFMIRTAAYRNKIELGKIKEVKKNHLYTFKIPFSNTAFNKPIIKKLKTYALPPFTRIIGNHSMRYIGQTATEYASRTAAGQLRLGHLHTVINEDTTSDYVGKVVEGFGTSTMDYKLFMERTHGVCSVCDGDLSFRAKNTLWLDYNIAVCGRCADEPEKGGIEFNDFSETNRWKGCNK